MNKDKAFLDWYDNAHWGNEDFKEGCHRSWNAAIKYTTPPAQPAPVQEPVACEEQHPNNRLLFKRLCAAAGIELGKDNIGSALDKVIAIKQQAAAYIAICERLERLGPDLLSRAPSQKQIDETCEGLSPLHTTPPEQPAPVQKPVYLVWLKAHCAWMHTDKAGFDKTADDERWMLYTTPPAAQRQWVGLTDEDLKYATVGGAADARKWEAKLKEKNT
jgi:hypothetical protein